MSPQNIVPAAGLNEISGSGVLYSLVQAAKNVKIYKSQCNELSKRCLELASSLQDHSSGLEGTPAQQAVDEVEHVLTRILKRVEKWAGLGKMQLFVRQTEIKAELEDSYKELQACSMQLNITLHLNASSRSQELEESRRRDHNELIEMITSVLLNKNPLKIALASGTPEDARSVVEAIEQELTLGEANFGETQERELQEGVRELRQWVEKLPPMVDLTGQVFRTSDDPIATGGSQDIYTGEWTGQEVALAYPRIQNPAAQERFQRQVEIWRSLHHPNVLQLLGIAYIDNFVCSVSPYMEFGNIIQYLKNHPEAPRILLLSEIASATEYLHSRGIIHGDLRGSNVLLSREGHACLADFGCARLEEVESTEPPTLSDGSLRWLAPELMTQSCSVLPTRSTDVWSFGMLCIEIFTDNLPFSHIQNKYHIPILIRDGSLPTRPEDGITTKGLTDAMWDLMNQCWRREPESRPKMPEIREVIRNMLPMRSGSQIGRSSSPIYLSGTRPSMSRLAYPTGLTPPRAPWPLLVPTTGGEGPSSEHAQRRSSPVTSFQRPHIIKDIALSSSPSPHLRTEPLPSLSNLSPLESPSLRISQVQLPTTLESPRSLPPSSTQPDWSEKSLRPLISRVSSSSNEAPPLLLERLHIHSPPKPNDVGMSPKVGTISMGSGPANRTPATSLLDGATRDSQPVLCRARDGTIEAGTLEGLVDYLVTEANHRAKDNEAHQRVFIATFRLFTTGEDLFGILKRRFDEMGDLTQLSDASGSIRYSILLFLQAWLSTEGEHMDRDLLSSIRTLASTISGSDTMKEMARKIVDHVSQNMNADVASPVSPLQPTSGQSLGPPLPQALDQFKATDIAFSLTVIEGERYAEISQADYVAHLSGAISKNIESATKVNNRLVNWVKQKILSPEDWQRRATYFRHFVLVAEECKKLQNFSSMSTIVSALQSTTSRLVLTREFELSNSEKRILQQLEELISPQGDHQAYREALKKVDPPFAVPWLAVHLRSLRASYDRSSAVVVVERLPLINFSHCTRLLQRIEEVQHYRAPALAEPAERCYYRRYHRRTSSSGDSRNGGAGAGAATLAWMKMELEKAPSSISPEKFEARVRGFAEQEREVREKREPELLSLGIPVPRQGTGTKSSSVRSPSARVASLDATRRS